MQQKRRTAQDEQGRTTIKQRIFYLATTAIGISLFVWILLRTGLGDIFQNIEAFGWAILLFILLEGFASIFYAWATRYCFTPESRTLSIWTLWKITMSERAISYITPTLGMGGDVVKWSIFERYCSPSEAASVVMIYRLAYFLSKLLFCVVWSVPIFILFPISMKLKLPLILGTVFLGGGLITFYIMQRKGLFTSSLEGTLGRLLGERSREWIRRHIESFDEHLRDYYTNHGRDFWRANFILWLGFTLGGVLQTWVFTAVVLHEPSPVTPLVVWILGSWADMVFFFVPAGLGTKEFARVLIFEGLNWPAATGAAFALVLRIEELFWSAVGLLLYVFMIPKDMRGKKKGDSGSD